MHYYQLHNKLKIKIIQQSHCIKFNALILMPTHYILSTYRFHKTFVISITHTDRNPEYIFCVSGFSTYNIHIINKLFSYGIYKNLHTHIEFNCECIFCESGICFQNIYIVNILVSYGNLNNTHTRIECNCIFFFS